MVLVEGVGEMQKSREIRVLTDKQAANLAKEASKEKASHSQKGITSKAGRVLVRGNKVVLD